MTEYSAVRDALSDLSMAVTTRALRGRDHVPSMRNEQRALAKAHAALSAKPDEVTREKQRIAEALADRIYESATLAGAADDRLALFVRLHQDIILEALRT